MVSVCIIGQLAFKPRLGRGKGVSNRQKGGLFQTEGTASDV